MVGGGKIGAGEGAAGGLGDVGALVFAVVELVGVEFGQVFEQAGVMTVLGVDQQVVLGAKRAFGYGVG